MGLLDAFSDMAGALGAVAPWSVVEAEAPAKEAKDDSSAETEGKNDDESDDKAESKDDKDGEEEGGDEKGGEDEEEEEEEEEEDEEEIVDPKETIEEECKKSAQCAPAKHHYDECAERVHKQESEGEAKEDCVEEFFHLAHCATACAAPKLWAKLK